MGASVAVMAGGTGGHVFPALAVAEILREQGCQVFWIGASGGMESRLVPQHGFEMEWVDIKGVRGKGLATKLAGPFRLVAAVLQARSILRKRDAGLAVGMGGFVSGPGGLAARLLGVPLVVQEQNSVPGMTNQWLARMAVRVFEAFPGSFPTQRAAEVSGNPVRASIAGLPAPAERFAKHDGPMRLLVVGGSLGAKVLNETVPAAVARLPAERRPQIRHQAGERTLELARASYAEHGVAAEVSPFIDDMAEAYAWADLVVCRSGALTVSELAAAGVGAILVPYPHAVDDHQVGNARYLSDAGAAELMIQSEFDAERLAGLLGALAADPARRLAMAEAARAKAQPRAAARIAEVCLEVARP